MVKKLSREFIKRLGRRGGDEISNSGCGGISPGAIEAALAGYAKEGWVNENYLSIEFFNRIFTIHGTDNNTDVDVEPNDLETTITSIEAMFGFWTEYYVSALGNGGDLGSTLYLSSLADVALTSPISDGQVLQYNLSTGKWTNATLNLGSLTLSGLSDVLLTNVTNEQFLMYDSTASKWVNSAIKTINGQSLIGSGDISVGGGASGNYLPLTGGTLTGSLQIFSTGSSWNEGIRVHVASDNWCGLVLCGSDNTGNSGTSALTWSLHNNNGTFYLANNGSNNYTRGFSWSYNGNPTLKSAGSLFVNTGSAGNVIELNSTAEYTAITYRNLAGLRAWVAGVNSSGFYFWNGLNNVVLTIHENAYVDAITGGRFTIGTIGAQGMTNHKGFFSAGPGYSVNSGRYGLRILCCDQADAQTGLGQDLATPTGYSNSYNLCVAGGNSSSDLGYISFVSHKVNSTSYRYLGGFRDSAGSVLFQVIGTIYATGNVTALSDARHKDVLCDAKIGVEQIADAPAVQFLWKGERAKEGLQVGTLAQYWQQVLPEVVMDKGGELSMQYGVAAMVSAIVTARKVVDHERRITELERENERLRTEIEQLRPN